MMQADAFDITTHTVMTVNAVQQSNLGLSPSTSSLIKSLGLRDDETAMGQNYLHMGSLTEFRPMGQFGVGDNMLSQAVDSIGSHYVV